MIDKLSLTINRTPDKDYLEYHGEITVDEFRTRLYKYMYKLDKVIVFCCPHKFSESTNANIPFTKVDINPNDFECFNHMLACLLAIFNDASIRLEDFKISRIDPGADMEDIYLDILLSTLNIKKIRFDSFNIFKGTIYGGSDPKIRIYDKVKEIKSRLRKNEKITEYEKGLLESGKSWIRFEFQIRRPKMTLQDLKNDPVRLASYFDRLEFLKLESNEPHGIMQFIYRLINRKYRKQIEQLKDNDIVEKIKERYISDVTEWFKEKEPF